MDPTSTPPITQPVAIPVENSTVLPSTPINKIWTKGIPTINLTFIIISALLVFGLDLMILISQFNLLPFWIEMLVAFGLFVVFFGFENYLFRNKFANTKSALDPWIVILIIVRNCVFILNFIPLIQLIGAGIGGIAIAPYVIIYGILISMRSKVT